MGGAKSPTTTTSFFWAAPMKTTMAGLFCASTMAFVVPTRHVHCMSPRTVSSCSLTGLVQAPLIHQQEPHRQGPHLQHAAFGETKTGEVFDADIFPSRWTCSSAPLPSTMSTLRCLPSSLHAFAQNLRFSSSCSSSTARCRRKVACKV